MKQTSLAVLVLIGVSCAAASSVAQKSKSAPQDSTATAAKKSPPPADSGERAFKANCSRCHYAPETLNPRITGTVIRHMRVRASLSAADERAILHYLNP